jgi:hypothetical protein
MRIAYLSSSYKWNVYGITRAYYESLRDLKHNVDLYRFKMKPEYDFNKLLDSNVEQVWALFSGQVFTDEQALKLRNSGKTLIGFNLTQDYALKYSHQFNEMFCNTIDIPDTHFLPPSFYLKYHRFLNLNKEIDAVYIGAMRGIRESCINRLEQKGINIKTYHKKNQLTGDNFIRMLNTCKIGVCFDTPAVAKTIPSRILEMAACGCLCIVPFRDDTAQIFDYGQEIIGYTDIDALVSKINHFLTHPESRQRVVKNCLRRCYEEHTSLHRVRQILKEAEKWN